MTRKSKFVATRSKAKALREAEAAGINAPIAVKVQGGFVVYQGYAKNPAPRKTPIKRKGVTGKKYVKRASQITRKPPTKRLQSRRKKMDILADAGYSGVFPNPARSIAFSTSSRAKQKLHLQRETSPEKWAEIMQGPADAETYKFLKEYAQTYATAHKCRTRLVRK